MRQMAPIQRLGGTERVSHSRYIVNVVSAQEYFQFGFTGHKEHPMLDLILISLGLGFFVAAVAYAYACDRL